MLRRPSRLVASCIFGMASAIGFAAIVACVDDVEPPAPAADAAAPDSATPDSATSSDADAPSPQCETYCDEIMKNCKGELRAYDNPEQCLQVCAMLPVGKDDDKSGNSVACRLTFAKAGDSKDVCKKASAFGGDVCGNKCDVFCDLVDKQCIQTLGDAGPYEEKGTCTEKCKLMASDPNGNEGLMSAVDEKDTLDCRMYHFILSLGSDASRRNHCPHVAEDSSTCPGKEPSDGGDAHGDGGHAHGDGGDATPD